MGGVALVVRGEVGDEGWVYQNLIGNCVLCPGPSGQGVGGLGGGALGQGWGWVWVYLSGGERSTRGWVLWAETGSLWRVGEGAGTHPN
eukprot:925012-Rhodomonas_salina.1